MSGAIALAGMAALRGGAGLVKLAVPTACLDAVASCEPSYMTAPLPDDDDGRIVLAARDRIRTLAAEATCLGCGPGLGRSEQINGLVEWLFTAAPQPLVLDADGLNALPARWPAAPAPAGARILTPHPGEFRRLVGDHDSGLSRAALCQQAIDLAAQRGVVVVLKGHQTLITDGHRVTYNSTGNPGMATGGSGDVLTGLIVALLCQGLEPFAAAQLGAYVHGLAGDAAAQELGEVSLIARDLVTYLPVAFQRLRSAAGDDR